MAFDNITTAEIGVNKPITNELLEKYRNRDEFLNGQIGTLSAIQILNNSFEINDTAVTGGAANWSVTPYTGGSATISTSRSFSGLQSLVVTSPGGPGNGGASALSDFLNIATGLEYVLSHAAISTGGIDNKVHLHFFKSDQSTLSISTVHSFGALGAWVSTHSTFVAPTSAKYVKVGLDGGIPTSTAAGQTWWDDVRIDPQPRVQTINSGLLKTATGTVSKAAPLAGTTYGQVTLADYTFAFNGYVQSATSVPPNEHIRLTHSSSNNDTIPRPWIINLSSASGDGEIKYRYITASQGFKGAEFYDKGNKYMAKHTLSNAPSNWRMLFDDMAKNNGWTWKPTTERST